MNSAEEYLKRFENRFLTTSVVHVDQVGWPNDSMMRPHHMLAHQDEWISADYVINIDADSRLVGQICEEFMVPSFGVWHPFFWKRPRDLWSFEDRNYSYNYVDKNVAPHYVKGSLFGGNRREFRRYLTDIRTRTDMDLNQNPPLIPLWHDESALNRAFFDRPPSTILTPFYTYPEPPSDLWITTTFPSVWLRNETTRSSEIKLVEVIKDAAATRKGFQSGGETKVTTADVTRNITAVVSHAGCRKCLLYTLLSLSYLYSGMQVVVVDSSQQYNNDYYMYDNIYMTVVQVDPGASLSVMRNAGWRAAKTPYVLFLDDNFERHENTKLEMMFEAMLNSKLDGIGAQLAITPRYAIDYDPSRGWHNKFANGFWLEQKGTTLYQKASVTYYDSFRHSEDAISLRDENSDVILNCFRGDKIDTAFIVRRSLLEGRNGLTWDERLRRGQDEDFFLRAKSLKYKFGFCHGESFFFGTDRDSGWAIGSQDEDSGPAEWAKFFQKHGVTNYVTPHASFVLSCGGNQNIPGGSDCVVEKDTLGTWL